MKSLYATSYFVIFLVVVKWDMTKDEKKYFDEKFKFVDEKFDTERKYFDEKFKFVDEKLNTERKYFDEKFDGIDKRFEAVDKKFESIDQRFERIENRLDVMDKKLDTIFNQLRQINDRLDHHDKLFKEIQQNMINTSQRISEIWDEVFPNLENLRLRVDYHEIKLGKLDLGYNLKDK